MSTPLLAKTSRPGGGAHHPFPASLAGRPTGTMIGMSRTTTTTLADHWGLVLTYGAVTFLLGAVLALWPGETLKVLTILVGLQFVIMGSAQLFLGLGSASLEGSARLLVGLSGAVAIVVGVLCFTNPAGTLKFIGVLIGVFWLVAGVADVLAAFLPDPRSSRVWNLVKGVISIGAGVFLVANPKVSLGFLVVVSCVWLLGYGFIVIVGALRLRTLQKQLESTAP
jgi:hypothetical protein